ncbi:MAG: hypothetical protein LBD29_00755 [Treponema sp.]|jgi:hypothetical protein|nr:hypothetical protein [Treponema sp.]
MAMTKEGMAAAVIAKIEAAYHPDTPLPEQAMNEYKKWYETVFDGVIEYVKANMDVLDGEVS